MAKVSEILKLAKSYEGTKESPANSNNVIFNTHYYGREVYDGLWGCYFPWCVTFVWDIFRMAGASNLFYYGKKTASCFGVQSWAKDQKLTVGRDTGKPGDLILFDWNDNDQPDHIGIVISHNDDGTYTTIEGNTSVGNDSNGGEVQIRKRYLPSIMMVIRPKYDPEDDIQPTPKPILGGTTNVELPILRKGSNNKSVHAAMVLMKEKGYYPYTIPSWDNLFGAKMEEGLRRMQKDHNLGVDGILGNNSWTFLLK